MQEIKCLTKKELSIHDYLLDFTFLSGLFDNKKTRIEYIQVNNISLPKYVNEFWTAKQKQSNSIHEIAYRACFKAQLPGFFIGLLTNEGDVVYDPFSGRGTTVIEAGLLGRNIIANDINPLSTILCKPRLFIPDLTELKQRLEEIKIDYKLRADIDLSMFYHQKTEAELVSLRNYFLGKKELDNLDLWIRMVATNRLTGHSKGFFSVYTLPPNQAITAERQKKINLIRKQTPEYRNVKEIIFNKSKSLMKNLSQQEVLNLKLAGERSMFLSEDARETKQIQDNSVDLIVTSPPFLDVVNYVGDNWLRCWFNGIKAENIANKITQSKKVEEWKLIMENTLKELKRVLRIDGHMAFEVGEVRNGKVKLDEIIAELGLKIGLKCDGIMINEQVFTKTANIWGIKNNEQGTNTNRIIIFRK